MKSSYWNLEGWALVNGDSDSLDGRITERHLGKNHFSMQRGGETKAC